VKIRLLSGSTFGRGLNSTVTGQGHNVEGTFIRRAGNPNPTAVPRVRGIFLMNRGRPTMGEQLVRLLETPRRLRGRRPHSGKQWTPGVRVKKRQKLL